MTYTEAFDVILAYVIGRYVPDPPETLVRCTPMDYEVIQLPEYLGEVREAIVVLTGREERILADTEPRGLCQYNDGVRVGVIEGVRELVACLTELPLDSEFAGRVATVCQGALDACDEGEEEIRAEN